MFFQAKNTQKQKNKFFKTHSSCVFGNIVYGAFYK
jgi:hypothetical protein